VTPAELGERLRHDCETERMELRNTLANQVLRVELEPDWPPDLAALAARHNEGADALAAGWTGYDAGLEKLPCMMLAPAMRGKLVAAAAADLRAARYDLCQRHIDALRSRQGVLVKVIDFLEDRSAAAAAELAKRQEAAGKKLTAAGLGPSQDVQVELNRAAAERRFALRVGEVPAVREARLAVENLRAALNATRDQVNHVDQDIAHVGVVLVAAWRDLTGIVP